MSTLHFWPPDRPQSLQLSIKWTLTLLLLINILQSAIFTLVVVFDIVELRQFRFNQEKLFFHLTPGAQLSAALSLVSADLVGLFAVVACSPLLAKTFFTFKLAILAMSGIFLLDTPELWAHSVTAAAVLVLLGIYVFGFKMGRQQG